MARRAPRRGPRDRARLLVTVASPDGAARLRRGLAAWLTQAAPRSAKGEVTVALVSDGRMRALNRAFRGKDRPTDVLSFPARLKSDRARNTSAYLGDIVIATGIASRQATEAGHPMSNELRLLALHGLLHLLGYDHETDEGQMARLERKLRRRAGLRGE